MPNPKNRISHIGLELEGGWTRTPPNLHRDGSVRGLPEDSCAVGELSSEPLPSLAEAEAWLRQYYPQHINETCGYHVHVSMPPLHYSRLICDDFNNKFLSEMESFHSRFRGQPTFDLFRSRLDGQNQYCQKIFRPHEQMWRTEPYGNLNQLPRYSQLNYCYGRHGTLECRLFPVFREVEHAIEGLRTFVTCINSFLASCKPARPIHMTLNKNDIRIPRVTRAGA